MATSTTADTMMFAAVLVRTVTTARHMTAPMLITPMKMMVSTRRRWRFWKDFASGPHGALLLLQGIWGESLIFEASARALCF
eukprot:7476018-Pyramimonas_sp.AAC.1